MLAPLPAQFSDLDRFVAQWGRSSIGARHAQRLSSSLAERQAFYDAAQVRLQEMLEFLNRFDLDRLPPEATVLLQLALSLMQVALAIENNGNGVAEAKHALSAHKVKIVKELDGM
jgi:hypothetical protein